MIVCDDSKQVTEEVSNQFRRTILKGGEIVLNLISEPGHSAIVPSHLAGHNVSRDVAVIPLIAGVDVRFVDFYLRSSLAINWLSARLQGSVTQKINLGTLRELPVKLPSRNEQIAIARLLGALDNRITLLRETNATLEAIAQALFKSWFVDFDPVRAKAEGRQPEGMDAATATLFPDSFEESELGLVPKGWSVRSIYEISRVIYGAPFASKRFNSEGVGSPLVRIRDLKDENPGVYTDEVHPKGYMIQPGDIVVGMDGEFRAYLWGGKPAWLNQRVCVFAPESGVPTAFVHRSISPLLAAVEASETATTVIHLGKNDIDRFRVVVPSQTVLAAFSELMAPIYSRIVEGKQAASSLANLRDTLLPRLISGQLRLPEAEALAAGDTRACAGAY